MEDANGSEKNDLEIARETDPDNRRHEWEAAAAGRTASARGGTAEAAGAARTRSGKIGNPF